MVEPAVDSSRRHRQSHHIAIPLGDGGEEKCNWASELSTIFPTKPIVVSVVGFLLGIAAFTAFTQSSHGVQIFRVNLLHDMFAFAERMRIRHRELSGVDKRRSAGESGNQWNDQNQVVFHGVILNVFVGGGSRSRTG